MSENWYAYCLKLGKGWYYVGISQKPANRLHSHKYHEGSELTRKYGMKKVVGVWDIKTNNQSSAEAIEENFTQHFTTIYGKNVRGAKHCTEEKGYAPFGGWEQINKYPNVTKPVLKKLKTIELMGGDWYNRGKDTKKL